MEERRFDDPLAAGEKTAYDAACKRLLSEKMILAWILKSCVEEFRDCEVREIAEKYIEGRPQVSEVAVMPETEGNMIVGMDTEDKSAQEGNVYFDIRFYAISPRSGERIRLIINVEAQSKFYPGYPLLMRAIYYCCRMISSQHGREFQKSHYEKVRKVYSIWICMNPPKNRRNTIARYHMAEENLVGSVQEPVRHYDLLTVVMVCLGGPNGENYDGILRMLDVLLSEETGAAEKRRVLQEDFQISITPGMESEVSTMCNLSEHVWEKGVAKGREEGMANGVLSSIRSLIANTGMPEEQAMKLLGIPGEERSRYSEMLRKQ